MLSKDTKYNLFNINNDVEFNDLALQIFHYQAENNKVYKQFIRQLNIDAATISTVRKIPFLPIELFKSHEVFCSAPNEISSSRVFLSSGTTGSNTSRHFVKNISVYEESFSRNFELFYGNSSAWCLVALLPSYLENKNSSLIYMVDHLIRKTGNEHSGFYLYNFKELSEKLKLLEEVQQKTILLGVSHALLDFARQFPMSLKHTVVMETGGMKGKHREMVREELHALLCDAFAVKNIHSEYGMTELLSQAYSKGKGLFYCPPWMKVVLRDSNDFFHTVEYGTAGGINVIDLANIYSCSFIATQDLGKSYADGSFEVAGRFDASDIRGCNLLV